VAYDLPCQYNHRLAGQIHWIASDAKFHELMTEGSSSIDFHNSIDHFYQVIA